MPTVATKTDVLEGRACVISYTRDVSSFYLRVRVPSKGGYKSRRIDGAETLQQAVAAALDTYLQLGSEDAPKPRRGQAHGTEKRTQNQKIEVWVRNYINNQKELADAGVIKPLTFTNKKQTLIKHILPYCEFAGLAKTTDIKVGSFDRYQTWRSKDNPTALTLKKEAAVVANLIGFLIKNKLLDAYEAAQKAQIPPKIRIVDSDYSSNPPIRDEEDWKAILTEMRRWIKEGDDHPKPQVKLHRQMFYALLLFLKQTGCRPVEARSLRWSDIEVEDIGRVNSKGERVSRFVTHSRILASKTGAIREVTSNSAGTLARWKKQAQDYLHLKQEKNALGYNYEITDNDYVFGLPLPEGVEVTSYNTLNKNWKKLMSKCEGKIKGPLLSERPYTIYSMRSSRAQQLMNEGVDVYLAANQLGHSVAMLEKVYARHHQRRRATTEAAAIEFGRRKADSRLATIEEAIND